MKQKNDRMKLLRERDDEAFQEFYEEYHKLVLYIAHQYTSNSDDDEEICQEVFTKFLKYIDSVDVPECKIKNLLSKITRTVSIDLVKIRKRQCIVVDDDFIETILAIMRLQETFLEKYSNILTKEELDVIRLRFVYNYKLKDISVLLEITEDCTKKISSSALAKIKEYEEKNSI